MKYLFALLFLMPGTTVFSQTKITGKDYYVSPDGNDANNGSKAHPFKTIMAAAEKYIFLCALQITSKARGKRLFSLNICMTPDCFSMTMGRCM